jgi:hypothetical protein
MARISLWLGRLLCGHAWQTIDPKTDVAEQYFGGVTITLECVKCGHNKHKRIKP